MGQGSKATLTFVGAGKQSGTWVSIEVISILPLPRHKFRLMDVVIDHNVALHYVETLLMWWTGKNNILVLLIEIFQKREAYSGLIQVFRASHGLTNRRNHFCT